MLSAATGILAAADVLPANHVHQQYSLQSYYQAVTTYQTQTYYEPVTTYQTSQYYEPVVTYRTSSYYCPNSCSYQTVQVPETGYQLKTKSCPVQSYVAKCAAGAGDDLPEGLLLSAANGVHVGARPPRAAPRLRRRGRPAAPCCQQAGAAPTGPPQVTATPGQNWQTPPPPIVDNSPIRQILQSEMPRQGRQRSNGGTVLAARCRRTPSGRSCPPGPGSAGPSDQARIASFFGADSVVEGEVVRGDKTPRPEAKDPVRQRQLSRTCVKR